MTKRIMPLVLTFIMAVAGVACGSGQFVMAEAATQTEASAEEFSQVIVDNDEVVFEIKNIDEKGLFGYTWNIFLENKTDKALMYALNNVSVNGRMADPFWATSIEPGMKSNSEISWPDATLKENGIDKVTQVEFELRIYDDDDWGADPVVEDTYTVYPMGEEAAVASVRESADTDVILFDNDNCSMTVIGFKPDDIFGYTMEVYLENKTDKPVMFAAESASVNGFMCDPFWAVTVAPGKASVNDISWLSSEFEKNGIETVESIELKMRVYDEEDFSAQPYVEETFSITPW